MVQWDDEGVVPVPPSALNNLLLSFEKEHGAMESLAQQASRFEVESEAVGGVFHRLDCEVMVSPALCN